MKSGMARNATKDKHLVEERETNTWLIIANILLILNTVATIFSAIWAFKHF